MKFLAVDGYEVLFGDDESHERLDMMPQRELIERIEYSASLAGAAPAVDDAPSRPQLQPGPCRDVSGLYGRDQARAVRGAAPRAKCSGL
jgi:hypothetical protein